MQGVERGLWPATPKTGPQGGPLAKRSDRNAAGAVGDCGGQDLRRLARYLDPDPLGWHKSGAK
ncbi:hypothetical protein JCM14036_03370 [Desulfotomaculum defluvii]